MASLNLCQFIGNVGADPEIRTFEGGNRIASLRIAVTERYTDRNNQQQERTEWVPLVFNGRLVDIVERYVRKGSSIYVQGKWHNREWQDQQGNKRQATELTVLQMQLLDKREQQQAAAPAPVQQTPPQPRPVAPAPPAPAQYPSTPQYNTAPVHPQPQYPPHGGYAPQYGTQDDGHDLPF